MTRKHKEYKTREDSLDKLCELGRLFYLVLVKEHLIYKRID